MSCFLCGSQPSNNRQFVHEALQIHNQIRRRHKVPPLKLSNDLTKQAQQWAEYLVKTNQDSPEVGHLKKKNIGESVTIKESYETCIDYSADFVMKEWYNGEDIYQPYYNREPPPMDVLKGYRHFTQMVWKSSKEMGMGKAIGPERTVIVALYRPGGNISMQYAENVVEPNEKFLAFKHFKM